MAIPLTLPATLTAGTPQNVNDLNSNLNAIVTEFNASIPQCRVTQTTTQSLTSGTPAAITFDVEAIDQGTPSNNMHDTVTNNSRITIRVAGLYLLHGIVFFASNGAGFRNAAFKVNGTTFIPGSAAPTITSGTDPTSASTTAIYRFAVNDYVELFGMQNSGGALSTAVNTTAGTFIEARSACDVIFLSQ